MKKVAMCWCFSMVYILEIKKEKNETITYILDAIIVHQLVCACTPTYIHFIIVLGDQISLYTKSERERCSNQRHPCALFLKNSVISQVRELKF